ncbi:MAG: urea amidolyase [Kangiella sp.]|nr:MAG: urea amidolyase [Kangiella sp.]
MLFIKAGLQTSVQDFGRTGTMHLGVSHSGAMDKTSLSLANYLVGNQKDNPALEITFIGPKIQFQTSMSIAVCGAQFDLYLNNELVFNNETIDVVQGDVLEFDKLISGARCYLAFSAQINLEKQLGSLSTHITARIGGFNNGQLKDSDQLEFLSTLVVPAKLLDKSLTQSFSGNYLLRCVESVETHHFSEAQKNQFFGSKYKIDQQSNRMGIRLNGNKINDSEKIQITSSGLTQGSIQITPSGLPIISSVDGQTIGGYPRIANIISADLSILGQLKAHDTISFELIDLEYASILFKQKQAWLKSILNS